MVSIIDVLLLDAQNRNRYYFEVSRFGHRLVCLVSLSSELFRRGSDMSNAPVFSLTFPLPAF